jgi:hypothetical protein
LKQRRARPNGTLFGVTISQGDVLTDELPKVDLVVGNIELRAVEALLTRFPTTRAIVSGYLADESPVASGWSSARRLELEGWAADVMTAK